MARLLLALYGVLALLRPRRLLDFWEPLAFENPADAEIRSWILPVARLEGLVALGYALRDDNSSSLSALLALIGIPTLLAPRQYLDFGLGIAYENSEEISVRSWVIPFTRLCGLLFVVAAIRRRAGSSAPDSADDRKTVEA